MRAVGRKGRAENFIAVPLEFKRRSAAVPYPHGVVRRRGHDMLAVDTECRAVYRPGVTPEFTQHFPAGGIEHPRDAICPRRDHARAIGAERRIIDGTEVDGALNALLNQAAKAVADRLVSRAEGQEPGYLLLNPCSFSRRVILELPEFPGPIPLAGPVKACQVTAGVGHLVVEVPALGFAWIPRPSGPGSNPSSRMKLADDRCVRNEFFEAEVDDAPNPEVHAWFDLAVSGGCQPDNTITFSIAPVNVHVDASLGVLGEINRGGVSIFLVEQNVHAALGLAHRAYILESGRIAGEGTGRALLDDPHVRRAYLGPLAARS